MRKNITYQTLPAQLERDKRLLELADNAKLSLASSSSSGAKEFSDMNTTEVSKKRRNLKNRNARMVSGNQSARNLCWTKSLKIERVERIRLDAATKKSELNLKLDTILSKLPPK